MARKQEEEAKKAEEEAKTAKKNVESFNKKVKIDTKGVLGTMTSVLPEGYIRPLITKSDLKKVELERQYQQSAYKRRLNYDDNFKEISGGRVIMPSQQDFLKIKIEEKEQML